MTENNKKALYESIMQKVSQQVVEMLNEGIENDKERLTNILNNWDKLPQEAKNILSSSIDKVNNFIDTQTAQDPEKPSEEETKAFLDRVKNMDALRLQKMKQLNPNFERLQKIKSLSKEQKQKAFKDFFDIDFSKKQCERYPNTFTFKNNKISMNISITDNNTNETKNIQLFGKSYGDVLRKYDILVDACVINLSSVFFEITTDNNGVFCRKVFRLLASEEYLDKMEDISNVCYNQVFRGTKTINELLSKLKKFKF